MKQPCRPEITSAILFIALILCLGLASLAFSWLPFHKLQIWLSSFAFDGRADFLTADRFQKMVAGTRLVGSFLIIIAAMLWIMRLRFARWIKQLSSDAGELIRGLASAGNQDQTAAGRGHLIILGLLTVFALAVRLFYIGLPIRYDEATTYMEYASKPIPVLLSYYSSPNNHIFHSLLVHVSTWLLGDGVWAIRLPAFLAGLLIIPASYLTFHLLYNRQVGLMAAAMTAASPVLVEFSVNARGYTLITLFFLILLVLMAYLREKNNTAGWALISLVAALGLWTIPVMAFPLAVACVWWLLSPPPGSSLVSWQRLKPLFLP